MADIGAVSFFFSEGRIRWQFWSIFVWTLYYSSSVCNAYYYGIGFVRSQTKYLFLSYVNDCKVKWVGGCRVHRFRRGTGAGAVCGAGGAVCGPAWVVSGRLKGPSRFTGRGDTVCVSLLAPHVLAPWSSNAAARRPLPCSVGSKYPSWYVLLK